MDCRDWLNASTLFPELCDYSSPFMEPNDGNEDEEEMRLSREVRSHTKPEARATEALRCVNLAEIENWHAGVVDEKVDISTQSIPSTRPIVKFPPGQQPKNVRPTPRVASRLGVQNQLPKKPRANFPKDKVKILHDWVHYHKANPYPSKKEKDDLAAQSNLTTKQVGDWFTRERKRNLRPAAMSPNSSSLLYDTLQPDFHSGTSTQAPFSNMSTISNGSFTSNNMTESPLLSQADCSSRLSVSPIERYESAPPQDEGSPLQTCSSLQNDGSPPHFIRRQNFYRTGARDGLGDAQAGGMTNIVAPSEQPADLSVADTVVIRGSTGQKGRRLFPPRKFSPERQGDCRYQCTTCNWPFKNKSDWIRHEKVHDPEQRYICMLNGPRLVKQGRLECPFCGIPDPTDDHLTSVHKISVCFKKHVDQRTYPTSNGLKSHMNSTHHAENRPPPDSWIKQMYPSQFRNHWCGFCGRYIRMTWMERVAHMEHHFLNEKLDMTGWTEERLQGLDPNLNFDFSMDDI